MQSPFSPPLAAALISISISPLIASYGYEMYMGDTLYLTIVYFCSEFLFKGFIKAQYLYMVAGFVSCV